MLSERASENNARLLTIGSLSTTGTLNEASCGVVMVFGRTYTMAL